jgi:serine/threonine protein kinase
MARFQPGVHVGGCRIIRFVASGDLAEVYEVIDPTNTRRALKIFEHDAPLQSRGQHRLAVGGEVAAMVPHVNIVRLIDVGIHDGKVWILLDYADGEDLRKVTVQAGGKLPVPRAVDLVLQAGEGMCAVHEKKIVHRDLKPENIVVTRDGVAKVSGFGSAKLPGWGVQTTTTQRTTSARYMAPERCKPPNEAEEAMDKDARLALDQKMDVYAMGVILYEAITGKNPIMPGPASLITIVDAQLHYEPPPLTTVVGQAYGNLSYLLQLAMAKDPTTRCTMQTFVKELRQVKEGLGVQLRQAVRSLPLGHRGPALAPTEQSMPAWKSFGATPAPPATRVPSGPGGTVQMSATEVVRGDTSAPAQARPGSDGAPARDAVLPPSPDTLRTPSYPTVPTTGRGTEIMAIPATTLAPTHALPTLNVPSALPTSVSVPQPLAATVPISDLLERRSTGAPVESTVTRAHRGPRAVPILAIGAVLLALGLAAGGLLFGRTLGGPDRGPAPAASVPPSTPATTVPTSSAVSSSSPTPAATASAASSPSARHLQLPTRPPRPR